MKKVFLILVALIGLGISGLAVCNLISTSSACENSDKSGYPDRCDNCTCPRCGGGVGFSARAYTQEIRCTRCDGYGKVTGFVQVQCRYCEGYGKQKCQGWESCSSCGGTGCKNGYTTNGGKNCAYGYCTYCNGKGGKYVTGRWTSCKNCSYCQGKGVREEQQSFAKTCPDCNGKGTKEQWQSGCYCYKCRKGYSYCD